MLLSSALIFHLPHHFNFPLQSLLSLTPQLQATAPINGGFIFVRSLLALNLSTPFSPSSSAAMTDRGHLDAASNGTANGGQKPASFTATKSQLYGATRPTYRPQPHHRRRRDRSCCCSVCFWLMLVIIVLVFIVGIASAIIYVLYRPQRPSFSVTGLKVSSFNLTSKSQLYSKFDLNVTVRNPNKKLTFTYNSISISVLTSEINVGDGLFPAFIHGKKNTTLLKVSIASTGQQLDSDSISTLKSKMKSKNGLPLEIKMDTEAKLKTGVLNTLKVGFRVRCDGITVDAPTGKIAETAETSNAKCKGDVRMKIWKWTI